ncbi:unnamed protein product [Staurois parvus]|uniref:Uncharacterized protein n=1 Tax=Staurois parvus TaxID=386267 RepID=A0ABN9HJV7_9NEOB|nr:unnamed protein product [Staurois parvus]
METAAMGRQYMGPMRDSGPGSSMRRRVYRVTMADYGAWQHAMGRPVILPAPYVK